MKNKRPTHEVVETQRAAAARLKTSLSEIRRAKNAGCIAFESGGRIRLAPLRRWLRDNPRPPLKAQPTADLPTGAAHALRRLEDAEAKAYGRMQAATDPDARDAARREWLAVSEQLRRADLAMDPARRPAGDMVSKAEMAKGIRVFTAYLAGALQDEMRAACPRIVGLQDPAAIAAILDPISTTALRTAVDRCLSLTTTTTSASAGFEDTLKTALNT